MILEPLVLVAEVSGSKGEAKTATKAEQVTEKPAAGAGSIHSQIDAMIAEGAGDHPSASLSDDAEFLRRVYLDFAGTIPGASEVRKFLEDTSPSKRVEMIDSLMGSPRYTQRMSELFNVHFMERRGQNSLWLEWLKTAFAENRPWDVMASQLIRADFRDEANRGAAYFFSRRLEKSGQNPTDYPGLTRDVGRLFLGMDLQCAQCHNHRLIDDYNQLDFQGLFATFANLKLLRKDYPAVEEGLMKEKLEYSSVFTGKKRYTGPRVPGVDEVDIPEFEKGKEYAQAPDKKSKTPGVPAFSPLQNFAEQVPKSPNFSINIVNRVWFMMMGRGLFEPLDQYHSENPPSHPELLAMLAEKFEKSAYDLKWLFRELALTDCYQRSSEMPANVKNLPADRFLVAHQRRMSAEQLLWSTLQATGHTTDKAPLKNVKAKSDKDDDFTGLRERFRIALGNEPKIPEREFSPSLKGALFMMNDDEVLKLLDQGEQATVSRLASGGKDGAKTADELYLSVYSRLPSEQESKTIIAYLDGKTADRKAILRDLVWAMLTSTEFVVNH